MGWIALITWFVTALGGLYMLAVWLIENDVTDQGAVASRLPAPVIFAHMLLALTGLLVWIVYLTLDRKVLAWADFFVLIAIALLGVTMFARWIPVYRGPVPSADLTQVPAGYGLAALPGGATLAQIPAGHGPAGHGPAGHGPAGPSAGTRAMPAEGNFPVAVVLAHGVLAISTLVLVLLTALGVGSN